MDLLKRERVQPDMSDGMRFRWVMGNRRNTRIGQPTGKVSGGTAGLRQHRTLETSSPERGPHGKPWKGVRSAKVARAKVLVRDDSYPSTQVMNSVAELLAKHMEVPR